jgi:hypothetical protein
VASSQGSDSLPVSPSMFLKPVQDKAARGAHWLSKFESDVGHVKVFLTKFSQQLPGLPLIGHIEAFGKPVVGFR